MLRIEEPALSEHSEPKRLMHLSDPARHGRQIDNQGRKGTESNIQLNSADRSVRATRDSTAQFLKLVGDVGVGHAGDVVAHDAGERPGSGLVLIGARKFFGMVHPERE